MAGFRSNSLRVCMVLSVEEHEGVGSDKLSPGYFRLGCGRISRLPMGKDGES